MQRRGDRVLGPYGPDRRGRYQVITITAGKRESTFCATREEAEDTVIAAREEQAAAEALTIGEATTAYLAHLRAAGRRPATVLLAERMLARFFPDPTAHLAALTPARAQRLYAAFQARPTKRGGPPAAATHHQALVRAKALLRWAVDRRLHPGPSPLAEVKPFGRARAGKPQLRIDEGRRWAKVALEQAEQEPGAAMAAAALLLGCRAGELVGCTVRDLDDGGTVLWLVGKTSQEHKPRPVEVPAALQPALLGLTVGKLPGAPLFGRGPDAVGWWARRICELAGIEPPRDEVHGLCAHSLRGMHATYARAAGATSRDVAATLGNSPAVLEAAYTAPGTAEAAERRRAQMRLVR